MRVFSNNFPVVYPERHAAVSRAFHHLLDKEIEYGLWIDRQD